MSPFSIVTPVLDTGVHAAMPSNGLPGQARQ
jgi:hypothetical protein